MEPKLLPSSHHYSKRLQRIGDRLLQANYTKIHDLLGDIEWKCYIIEEKNVNAFVLPVRLFLIFIMQRSYRITEYIYCTVACVCVCVCGFLICCFLDSRLEH
jgi:hypothetical protein